MNSLRLFRGSPVYSNRVDAASQIVYRWRFFIGGAVDLVDLYLLVRFVVIDRRVGLLRFRAPLFKKDWNLDSNVKNNELSQMNFNNA